MKRSFLLLCTVLLVLGCALPCAAYRFACMALVVQGTAPSAAEAASVTSEESSRGAPSPADTADTVCFTDQSTGQTVTLPLREYLIGAVAAEMPVSWPDEALKAQAVAAHSYALYRRDHSTEENGAWFTADPARRQGCLTDAVLHSYWGTAYAANYARLSALVDAVQTQVLYYGDAPAGTSYFAMSNGRTEASEKDGFPEKRPPEPDSVQAAHERISGRIMFPHFNGMGKTQFVQAGVGIHHFGHDPRPVLIRARRSRASRHDVAKGLIDGHGKAALAYFLTDGMRDTEFFRKQDAPGIGGPPEQRLPFPVPRENPGAVGRQQTADAQVAADRHKALWIGPFRIRKQFRVIGMQTVYHTPCSRRGRYPVYGKGGLSLLSTFNINV